MTGPELYETILNLNGSKAERLKAACELAQWLSREVAAEVEELSNRLKPLSLTASAEVTNISAVQSLVCADCGSWIFVPRCTKRDGEEFTWRCHKADGHKGACSTHMDCGEVSPSGVVCGGNNILAQSSGASDYCHRGEL